MILFPEIKFNQQDFLAKIKENVERHGFCTVVASEGVRDSNGEFLSASSNTDSFGHSQLGGVAPKLGALVQQELGYKNHWAVCDYLQRAARHVASQTDVDQAYATGKAAVEFAIAGINAVMPIIIRESSNPYKWKIDNIALEKVANIEREMPREYITPDGYGITEQCRDYLTPLIAGEAYPPYKDGLPDYLRDI